MKQLRGVISYHSYSQLILYPWGYTNETAPGADLLRKQTADYRQRIKSAGGVNYTAEQASALYITNGDTTDWVWKATSFQVPPYTVELRPESMFGGGFILPESQIEPTWKENGSALLALLKTWTMSPTESDVANRPEGRGPKEPAATPETSPR